MFDDFEIKALFGLTLQFPKEINNQYNHLSLKNGIKLWK